MESGINEFLEDRKKSGTLRSLHPASARKDGAIYIGGRRLIDFSSNDYLGLSCHPFLKEASIRAIAEYGLSSSASRLLSGDTELYHDLEERVAVFKGKDAALVYNSGYQANIGIISALVGREDAVFSDRLNHASIVDGIILSGAKHIRFRHNDIEHLKTLLTKERPKYKKALIVTESLFSMDGDMAALKDITDLKNEFDVTLLVDEAHATGLFGPSGSGIVEELKLTSKVDIIMGTFGKALGSFGAYCACSHNVKDYLINVSRSFIYSTALPPPVIAANIASIDLIKKEPWRRTALAELAAYFRERLKDAGIGTSGQFHIMPVVIGDSNKTVEIASKLQDRGFLVYPIRPPTVPDGSSRLRFSLSYSHKRTDIERAAEALGEIYAL